MNYYIIKTRCPNGCKYKSGNTCLVSECPYQTGYVRYDIRLNAEDKPTTRRSKKNGIRSFCGGIKRFQ